MITASDIQEAREDGAGERRQADPSPRAVTRVLADLVGAIGRPKFGACFLQALHVLAGFELCSAFRQDRDRGAELLFAAGEDPYLVDFSISASRDYARSYWRSDLQIADVLRHAPVEPTIVRRSSSDIANPAYRTACYDRAGIVERVSIVWVGQTSIVANGYRTTAAGPCGKRDIERLELYAGLLIAALERHCQASVKGLQLTAHELAARLLELDFGLSEREAEVAAGLILGETQPEIAEAKHLSVATIATYRRRAYGKLGVANRRGLLALHRRLVLGSGEAVRLESASVMSQA